jgi:hypothetical protein
MKSLSKIELRNDDAPADHRKRLLTVDELVEKWAGVFEPEFWEEVRNARDCYPPPPSERRK